MAPADHRRITELLEQIAETASTAQQTIEQVTEFTAQTFDTEHVGVTMIRDHGRAFETLGQTSELVRRADELQDELVQGPCVDASVLSQTVISRRLADEDRWPDWAPHVAAIGLGSILSTELHAGGRRFGALNIYGTHEREFTSEDMELGHVLAAQASVALRFTEQIEGLQIALGSRTLIGQAQGVLMERFKIDADRAFAVLKRYSQTQNVRLVEVAQHVVDGASGN